ncbi:MAG: hypothetical protein HYV17_09665 [Xanthomonadales bacterium]|nr:hypothetical protein [Xanthomonadales bacterium]
MLPNRLRKQPVLFLRVVERAACSCFAHAQCVYRDSAHASFAMLRASGSSCDEFARAQNVLTVNARAISFAAA